MEDKIVELVDRLKKAHQDRLRAVIVYGSAAGAERDRFSDINVLCVLEQVGARELGEAEPVFRWWREQRNPAPLLFSEREVQTSTDCFPMEFHDMQERRRVVFGADVIADLVVDRSFYRAQVEHELRAKLLRLRQKAGAILSDPDALLGLMLDSVSTFCVLARHALLLSGIPAPSQRRETIRKLSEIGVDQQPFERLIAMREMKGKPESAGAIALFEDYLRVIQSLVAQVDRLDK